MPSLLPIILTASHFVLAADRRAAKCPLQLYRRAPDSRRPLANNPKRWLSAEN